MVSERINTRSLGYSVRGVKATTENDGTLTVKLPAYHRAIRTHLYRKLQQMANILAAIAVGGRLGIELPVAAEAS